MNIDRFLRLSRSQSLVRVMSHRQAPPTTIDEHCRFITDPLWVTAVDSRSRGRHEYLLSDSGVLLLDVIINKAVVVYSRHLNLWRHRWLCLILKGIRPLIYLNAFMFGSEGRGEQGSLAFKGTCTETGRCFWQGKRVLFYTTIEKF